MDKPRYASYNGRTVLFYFVYYDEQDKTPKAVIEHEGVFSMYPPI